MKDQSPSRPCSRRGMIPSGNLGVLVPGLLVMLLSACTSGPEARDRSTSASQARLLAQRDARQWTEVETGPGEPGPVTLALLNSRQRVLPFLEREVKGSYPQEQPPASQVEPARQDSQEEKISVHLRGTPLSEAVDLLAEPLGLNIILLPGLNQPVTVNFPAITPRQALDAILAQSGYMLESKDGLHRVRRQDDAPDQLTRTFSLRSGQRVDTAQLEALLTPERGKMTVDGSGTTLVVTDEEAALLRVETYLALMDRRHPQVLIEALIMEVQHSDDLEWGMLTRLEKVQVGEFAGGVASDFSVLNGSRTHDPFTLGVVSPEHELDLTLSADQNITRINVLSNPLISTVSGQEAKLEVIEKVPYVESINTINVDSSGGATNTSQQVKFKDVGVRLTVTPSVGGDDIIEMKVEPEVLELVDFLFDTPVIDERRVVTTVYVRNNETIVLAGLLREGTLYSEDKVPILGDIPLLGNLFRGERTVQEKRELLIFLTPHLMSAGMDALKGFQAERFLLDDQQRFPELERRLQEGGREK